MHVGRRVVGMSHALSGTAHPNSNAKIQLFSAYDSFLSKLRTTSILLLKCSLLSNGTS